MPETYIIAEAGVNHNGRLDCALQLVEAAANAGADAIKFQTFRTELLVTPTAQKADYQKNPEENHTQASMLKALELQNEDYPKLLQACQQCNIDFLSTPFDIPSLQLLLHSLQLNTIKIGSGELTNSHLLLMIARSGAAVILSTGMATLGDIEQALAVLAFGYLATPTVKPSLPAFMETFYSAAGQSILQTKVTLLHCVTDYPAEDHTINLRALDTLQQAFHLPIGYSDHSLGIYIPIAAVARGAVMIEKHLTLDKNAKGPDHKASLTPDEFNMMVNGIRQVENALGVGKKIPSSTEIANRQVARRSIVAHAPIKKGQLFSETNLTTKRPLDGVSAIYYWDYIGQSADRDYAVDDMIGTKVVEKTLGTL